MSTPPASPARALDATTADTSTLAKALEDLSGQTLGDFKLLRKLGAGGMGQVYLAEQSSLKRRVAVKLLRADLQTNEKFRKRFATEATAAAQLNHPSIVQVHAVGEHDGLMFMALEYVEGWTLRDYLLRKGPPELTIAVSIMRQVAAALARAAELGIVHRDIKPENILLTRKVDVKVTDFGLAKILASMENENLTQTGVSMGTPLYMSPEQVQGVPLDPRSDIYCFGATCYHMLSGQPPFTAESAIALAFKHVQEEPVPLAKLRPDLPPELCAMVVKMMAKKPEDRYQSAREILRDLKKLAEGRATTMTVVGSGTPSRLPTPPDDTLATLDESTPPLWRPTGRRPWTWVVGVSVLSAVVLGVVVGLLLRGEGEKPNLLSTQGVGPAPTARASASAPQRPIRPQPPERDKNWAKNREASLREEIIRTEKPPGPFSMEGMRCRIEMYHFLLKELDPPELDKMYQFVGELEKSDVAQYKTLSVIGQALFYAWKEKPKASYDQFERLMRMQPRDIPLGRRQGPPILLILRGADRELSLLVCDAIERNQKLEPLPPEVDRLYQEAKRKRDSGRPLRP